MNLKAIVTIVVIMTCLPAVILTALNKFNPPVQQQVQEPHDMTQRTQNFGCERVVAHIDAFRIAQMSAGAGEHKEIDNTLAKAFMLYAERCNQNIHTRYYSI